MLPGLGPLPLQAQFTEIWPQDPPGIAWEKIDTAHFEVVFPRELTRLGQRAANTLEYVYDALGKTLHQDIERITVILSNQGVIANGYVTLAPRRSEWFAMPMAVPDFGVADWIELLAVHEGRHIFQFDKMNRGLGKILGFLCGDLGRMANISLSAPLWFYEGDAVGIETALTGGGRGREPSFDMDIRALLVSGQRYSYDKAHLRSYKDWFPSWYHLGYLLTTHVKRTYGAEAWSRVLDRIAKVGWKNPSFSSAMKKEIGKSAPELYREAMDALAARWNGQLHGLDLSDFKVLNTAPRGVWTNYTHLRADSDGTIYAQKFGLADALELVRLGRDGKEEVVAPIAPLNHHLNRLSVEKGTAVWNEYVPDPRWGKRSYSDLFLFDLRNGTKKRLTRGARLFDPALSPDGKRIAAVEFAADYRCALVVIDAGTGREIERTSPSDEDLLLLPAWSEDGSRIVMVRQNSLGRSLCLVDVRTMEERGVVPPSLESVVYPVFFGDFILYQSPCSGIDNIYAVHARTGERFQVTSSRFGAFFPAVSRDGRRLLYSDYSVDGYNAAEAPLDPASWKRLEDVEPRNLSYYEPLVSQEQGGDMFGPGRVPDIEYEVKPYSPSAHLVEVHSWLPVAAPPEYSLLFLSSDKLAKSSMTGGVKYHADEKVLGFEWGGSYAGLFPVLDFGIGYGGRSASVEDENGRGVSVGWRETSARAGFRFPLDLTRGSDIRRVNLGAGVSLTKISGREFIEPLEQGNGRLASLDYFFNYLWFRQPAIRDLYPSPGYSLDLAYRHTPFQGDYKGALFSAKFVLSLPGPFKHHGLRLSGGYERQDARNYRFPNEVLFPRGYDYDFHESLVKASVDYALPLAYPDLALGGFLYLKRLKLNAFFDYGLGKDGGRSMTYRSAGIDFLADLVLFRLPFEIETGPRLIYRREDKRFRLEWLIFGIGL